MDFLGGSFCFRTVKLCSLKYAKASSRCVKDSNTQVHIVEQSNLDGGWWLRSIQHAPGVLHLVTCVHFKG